MSLVQFETHLVCGVLLGPDRLWPDHQKTKTAAVCSSHMEVQTVTPQPDDVVDINLLLCSCFPAFQTCASVALQTTKDSKGLLRPCSSNNPSNWHKDTFFDLHSLLRVSKNFRRLESIAVWRKRGLTFHRGATPLKGALLSSLRYQWTIYLFKYLISVVPVLQSGTPIKGVLEKCRKEENVFFLMFFFHFLYFFSNEMLKCCVFLIYNHWTWLETQSNNIVSGLNWR